MRGMTFESNRLKQSSGVRAGCDSRGTVGTPWWPDHKTLYACTFLSRGSQQSGSGIENLSTMRRARMATTQEEKMSVFGSIVSAIFGSKHAAGVTATPGSPSPPPSPSATSASAGMAAGATAAKPISKADVEAILAKLDDEQDEDLDWKTSIVDLMKLLKLDSSLGAPKQLARDLGSAGALDASAAMNVWLQKQVMTKLAESGGKVPDSLRA